MVILNQQRYIYLVEGRPLKYANKNSVNCCSYNIIRFHTTLKNYRKNPKMFIKNYEEQTLVEQNDRYRH